jgi:hypothetical protein
MNKKPPKPPTAAETLARKKASKNSGQNNQVTSNIPSIPTSMGTGGRGLPTPTNQYGPGKNNQYGPARGYKTVNPYKGKGVVEGLYNYDQPGSPKYKK